jgi:hypothetical protein
MQTLSAGPMPAIRFLVSPPLSFSRLYHFRQFLFFCLFATLYSTLSPHLVLDHERFAREVLGRWFKHQNFSSFVRQLNMYGFHKIPHLQQGVLRSDSETEFWNFAHGNFHRGQADLLCLIQRKKQSSQQQMQMQQQVEEVAAAAAAVAAAGLVTDVNGNSVIGVGAPPDTIAGAGPSNPVAGALGASSAGSTGIAALNNSQLLDIHSIVQGIAAIKRHQSAISVELSELKQSNEMLWQDALLAREKHQKQDDTINRIVKFLAGVFGKHAPRAGGVGNDGGHHGGEDGNPGMDVSVQRRGGGGGGHQQEMHQGEGDGMGVVTRRRARLMIEDVRRQAKSVPPRAKPGVNAVEVSEESDDDTIMADSTAGMTAPGNTGSGNGGGGQPTSPVTLSNYRSPPSPSPSLGILDVNDDPATTSSFSGLDLNGGPDPAGATRNSLEYPRIDMDIETPKSVNTPLPTSPAETVMGSNEKKETTTSLNPERALTHTPPIFQSQQGSSSNDNTAFPFDPRSLMINLTPAQIQQLLTSLATQTIPDPSGNSNTPTSHYGGFLTSVDSDRGSATPKREGRTLTQPNGTPPFDISSYLLPSPLLSNLSIGAGASGSTAATSPAPTTSTAATPTTSPMLSNSTPRAGGTSESYRPGAASAPPPSGMQIPILDGLISFDGSDANAAAASSSNAGSAAATNSASAGPSEVPYAGDLSVGMRSQSPFMLSWPGYQQTYGAYPPPVVANSSSSSASGPMNGIPPSGYPYGFQYNPDAGWGNVGSGSPGVGGAGADYAGLFSPVMQGTPRVGYPGVAPNTNEGQNQNHDVPYNNDSTTSASNGGVGSHSPALAALSSSWQAADDIDRDVSAMNMTIHGLIQMLGLDTMMDGEEHAGEEDGEEDGTGTGTEAGDYDNFASTWPGGDANAKRSPSDSATMGVGSTPSGTTVAGSGSHTGSVTSEAPDGFGDGDSVDGTDGDSERMHAVLSANPLVTKVPLSSARPLSAQSVASSSAAGVVPVDDGATRPINKKARTGLTASAATSAGVPTTVVEAGGRKRRSVIVNAPADELDGVDEHGGAASQAQTKGAATAVASGKGTKSKKRRG